MILSKSILENYKASRLNTNKNIVCHAPSVNLNFEQTGEVRACCYNFKNVLGKWPEQSIREIWEGKQLKELRNYINDNQLGGGCIECGRMIVAGNHQGVRAKYYDEYAGSSIQDKATAFLRKVRGCLTYPRVMEFELSNECNLECIMCNGSFSSSIRKNREKLPPIVSPYNEKFVDELEEFIPHLTDVKFLGGEPFMIEIYLKIWERILKINPNIRIHITTNGTFLNNRIKDLLEGLNAGIILSIDTIVKETYQNIRINGNYDKVMENLDYFIAYTKRKNTFISIASCPIIHNWKELPALLDFCLAKNISLHFNAVFTPHELSLREQSVTYLQDVIDHLEKHLLPTAKGGKLSPSYLSVRAYTDFINLLKGWQQEKQKWNEKVEEVHHITHTKNEKNEILWSLEAINETINRLIKIEKEDQYAQQEELQDVLGKLLIKTPNDLLSKVIMYLVVGNDDESGSVSEKENLQAKLAMIADLINEHPHRNEILKQTAKASPSYFAALIQNATIEELNENLRFFFNANN